MRPNVLIALSLTVMLGACTQHITIVPKQVDGFAPWSNEVPPHRLAGGDEFDLKFLLNPELNDAKLVIGPDGRVTVPLLGDVVAGGLTLPEFRKKLQDGYASKLRVADLDVVVRNYASSRIFVGGDVKTPGVLPLQGPTDALQGVLMAGGFLPTSRSSEVVLIRRRADNAPMLRTLNLRRYAGSADMQDDLPLQPSDVIFVPKADIAEFDLFVDQYLNQALPFQKTLNYNLGGIGQSLF
ncbi:polysaccharide biosynthesis/export family protein [Acidisphaera sp. L21]|uniref:polysaccharide biosynthesis/export family protein n=1 Tax=Acidisphaera sp. L21 TaxID=1641851 RepID=UPI00131BD1C5|nr:polysaccharide biosynthesis/export family protein [Acidisphaera sp. L21]